MATIRNAALFNSIDRDKLFELQPIAPTASELLGQIARARDEIYRVTGTDQLAAFKGPSATTATEIMARIDAGPSLVESLHAVERAEDWSRVRSPGRARRRRHKHRQNIRGYYKPAAIRIGNKIYVHPEIMKQVRALATQAHDDRLDALAAGMLRSF